MPPADNRRNSRTGSPSATSSTSNRPQSAATSRGRRHSGKRPGPDAKRRTGSTDSNGTRLLPHAARHVLDEHGIDEPVQWAPQLPDHALHGLQLPGPDPHSISPERLHQAVPGSDFSIAQLARTLETTTAHVVHLLSEHPVDWSPPRFRRTQHTAARAAQWRRWYEGDCLSLQAIADREGTSLATVRLALLKDGTQLRPAGSYPGRPRRR
ncbi:hypothetical protein OG828_48670 [Streptomyces sp. NBC_00457]|uniref:hypothetical protein n=1 Tax=Streptomyces sp. NBC_00457 TaxID=2975748 RepID=UPI002E2192F7